ncbi:hypothetical protein V1Y59_02640 [Gordonia sp. PKS22-38]|uniref:Uncharacterized protein n=1 Tax=Gordonia prachuapensis TaxID=3115651 RepID=A0ABU7MNR6_9ACTN|nr:hypothetical protein [Gordonia sp. PKS22-38]
MLLFLAPQPTKADGEVTFSCNSIIGDQHSSAQVDYIENRDGERVYRVCAVARDERLGWAIVLAGPTLIAATACLVILAGGRSAPFREVSGHSPRGNGDSRNDRSVVE